MLNRRLLRAKAMQSLYGLVHTQRATYDIALDKIHESFEPAWITDRTTIDFAEIEKNRQFAQTIFANTFKVEKAQLDSNLSQEIKAAVLAGHSFYKNQLQKDKNFYASQLERQIYRIYDLYLMLLLLVSDLSEFVRQEEDRIRNSFVYQNQPLEGDFKFKDNQFCKLLRGDNYFQKELLRKNISWNNYRDVVHNLFRQVIKHEEFYQQYDKSPATDFEQDKSFVGELIKQVLLKQETISKLLEELDSNWTENGAIVKDMLNKTLKQSTADKLELMPLSLNWEDDYQFLQEIYKLTWEYNDDFEEIINQKSTNWDLERLALIDTIIIKMAICEMLYFPSIPVKVSINEYIEISKNYSTPKSKQFVNGLLDSIAQDLQQQGKIRKTGRGLMDNK